MSFNPTEHAVAHAEVAHNIEHDDSGATERESLLSMACGMAALEQYLQYINDTLKLMLAQGTANSDALVGALYAIKNKLPPQGP